MHGFWVSKVADSCSREYRLEWQIPGLASVFPMNHSRGATELRRRCRSATRISVIELTTNNASC